MNALVPNDCGMRTSDMLQAASRSVLLKIATFRLARNVIWFLLATKYLPVPTAS